MLHFRYFKTYFRKAAFTLNVPSRIKDCFVSYCTLSFSSFSVFLSVYLYVHGCLSSWLVPICHLLRYYGQFCLDIHSTRDASWSLHYLNYTNASVMATQLIRSKVWKQYNISIWRAHVPSMLCSYSVSDTLIYVGCLKT